ncbi:MAG: hypothetical protein KGJ02_05730 [Verrucomicrobiota bacterium]|nr:hypothetical protein [Verrucomicrobiota bacterium]
MKVFFACLALFSAAFADGEMSFAMGSKITRLPEEFFVTERLFSPLSTFDISTDLEPLAVVSKRFFSFTPSFDLEDVNNGPLASASAHFFTWGTIADVKDPKGQKIGCIEEEIWRIFPWAEYRVLNALGEVVSVAKMDLLGTEFSLFHPDFPDHIYATISRPIIHWLRDSWTVRIFNKEAFEQTGMDPRLLMMLAVYQTDKDNRDRWRILIESQISTEIYQYEGTRF